MSQPGNGRIKYPALERSKGAHLRAIRVARNETLETFGRHLRISPQEVQDFESGKARMELWHVHTFAAELGVPIGRFYSSEAKIRRPVAPSVYAATPAQVPNEPSHEEIILACHRVPKEQAARLAMVINSLLSSKLRFEG
jgi:hypothetical protein